MAKGSAENLEAVVGDRGLVLEFRGGELEDDVQGAIAVLFLQLEERGDGRGEIVAVFYEQAD